MYTTILCCFDSVLMSAGVTNELLFLQQMQCVHRASESVAKAKKLKKILEVSDIICTIIHTH